MRSKKQSSPEKISELEPSIFELLCHIDEGTYVLDVGCGVGITPCYIAKRYGCRVVGVDISERMIDRANERAKREDVENIVEFRVADVQNLPFEDTLFDVVIGESIVAFAEDKQRAVSECVRVTKPGGYVGLNESIWIKAPPPEMVEYISHTSGAKTEVLTSDGWEELLEGSGLRDIVARTYKITVLSDSINQIRRLGFGGLARVWYRALRLYVARPAYRSFLKEAFAQPKNLIEYLGYGIYIGRK